MGPLGHVTGPITDESLVEQEGIRATSNRGSMFFGDGRGQDMTWPAMKLTPISQKAQFTEMQASMKSWGPSVL